MRIEPFGETYLGVELVNLDQSELVKMQIRTNFGRLTLWENDLRFDENEFIVQDGIYYHTNYLSVEGIKF